MDPLTITTGAVALISTIVKVSYEVTIFVKHVRDARSDLDHVSRELLSLKNILELLAEDTEGPSKKLPDGLQNQIGGIINGCTEVVLEIDKTMKKYEGGGVMKGAKWALGGKEDMSKLQKSLEAHKTALDLALDMVQLTVSKEIKNDTTQLRADAEAIKSNTTDIKADTAAIRDDTALILAEIARLQEKVEEAGLRPANSNFMLEKYLDGLTTYAETVIDGAYSDDDESFEFNSRPVSREGRAQARLPKTPEQKEQDHLEQLGLSHNDLEALGAPPSYDEATTIRRAAAAAKATESSESPVNAAQSPGEPSSAPAEQQETSVAPASSAAQPEPSSVPLPPVTPVVSQTQNAPVASAPAQPSNIQADIKAALAHLNAQNEESGFSSSDSKNPFISQLSHFENPTAFPQDVKHIPLPSAPASTEVFLATSFAGSPAPQATPAATSVPVEEPKTAAPTVPALPVLPASSTPDNVTSSQGFAQAKGERFLPNWYSESTSKPVSEPTVAMQSPAVTENGHPERPYEAPLQETSVIPAVITTPRVESPIAPVLGEQQYLPLETVGSSNGSPLPPRPPKIPYPQELDGSLGYGRGQESFQSAPVEPEPQVFELEGSGFVGSRSSWLPDAHFQLPRQYTDPVYGSQSVEVSMKSPPPPPQLPNQSEYHDWGAALAEQHLSSREGLHGQANGYNQAWNSEPYQYGHTEQGLQQHSQSQAPYQPDPILIQQMIEQQIKEQLASQKLAEELAAADRAQEIAAQNARQAIPPLPRVTTSTLADLRDGHSSRPLQRSATMDDSVSTTSTERAARARRHAARREYSKNPDVLNKPDFQKPPRYLSRRYEGPEIDVPEAKRQALAGKVLITAEKHGFKRLRGFDVLYLQAGDRVKVERTFEGTWWVGRQLSDNKVGWFNVAYVDLDHAENTVVTPTDSMSPITAIPEEHFEAPLEQPEPAAAPVQQSYFQQAMAGASSVGGRLLTEQVVPYLLDKTSVVPKTATYSQANGGHSGRTGSPAVNLLHNHLPAALGRAVSPLPTLHNTLRSKASLYFEPPPDRPVTARSASHGAEQVPPVPQVPKLRVDERRTRAERRQAKTEEVPQTPRQTAPKRPPIFESQPLVDGRRVVDMELPARLTYLTRVDPVFHNSEGSNNADKTEFTHVRCSEVTCTPLNLGTDNYRLRPQLYTQQRETNLLVLFEINKHDEGEVFVKKLAAVYEAIETLCSPEAAKTVHGWDRWSWRNVVLVILDKGYWKDPQITQSLKDMGLLRDWTSDDEELENEPGVTDHVAAHPKEVDGEEVKYRIFEHTSIAKPASIGKVVSLRPGSLPIQTIVCSRLHEVPDIHLKDPRRNETIPWINGFCGLLNPQLAIYITSKTDEIPKPGLIKVWKEFETRKVTGKPCSNFPNTAVPTIDFGAFQASFWKKMFGSSKSSGLEWFEVQPVVVPGSTHLKKFQDAIKAAGKQAATSPDEKEKETPTQSWTDIAAAARKITAAIPGDTGRVSPQGASASPSASSSSLAPQQTPFAAPPPPPPGPPPSLPQQQQQQQQQPPQKYQYQPPHQSYPPPPPTYTPLQPSYTPQTQSPAPTPSTSTYNPQTEIFSLSLPPQHPSTFPPSRPPIPPPPPSHRATTFQVRAMFAYDPPRGTGELGFAEGEVITVLEEVGREWYRGFLGRGSGLAEGGRREGLVPRNFVVRI